MENLNGSMFATFINNLSDLVLLRAIGKIIIDLPTMYYPRKI